MMTDVVAQVDIIGFASNLWSKIPYISRKITAEKLNIYPNKNGNHRKGQVVPVVYWREANGVEILYCETHCIKKIKDIPECFRGAFLPFAGSKPNIGFARGNFYTIEYLDPRDPYKQTKTIIVDCMLEENRKTGHVRLIDAYKLRQIILDNRMIGTIGLKDEYLKNPNL